MRLSKFPLRIAAWLGAAFLVFSAIMVITPSIASAAITQSSPTTVSTTTTDSATFTDQIEPTTDSTDANLTPVVYTTTVPNASVTVSASGAVSTSGGPLAANSYTVSGTDTDGLGDNGTWTYTLTVSGVTISQSAPLSATSTEAGSSTFTDQLQPTTLNSSAVTYVTSASSTGLSVSSTGAVSTTGLLAPGPYTVSGTDSDTLGDTGVWSYTLTVTSPSGGPPPSMTTLVQTSPTSSTTTTDNSSAFTGSLTVSGATGAVTYVTVTSSPSLSVSAQGKIASTGPLATGNYTVSGTDSDLQGDTGTWVFSLTVNAPIVVTFDANGGTGSMAAETKASPSPLTPNTFTWTNHVFDQWNTAADGSGTSYANGANYPFTASTTLYAQWTATTVVAPKHTVTFNANSGTGSMSPETKNVLASLTLNSFKRAGFQFVSWNTAANGSGTSYDNGSAYKFTTSATLYAQWKATATFRVTFRANGGKGSMKTEAKKSAAPLSSNQYTRAEFKFVKWSTAANGSGTDYANGQSFNFKSSISLYAQWSAVKVPVTPTAVNGVEVLSPFGLKSSALSDVLESQITALASEIKTNHDTKISLVGYSGDLTTAEASNESDWAASIKLGQQRAVAVEGYLKTQLASLGVTGYTISAVGSAATLSASATQQPVNRKVVATIS